MFRRGYEKTCYLTRARETDLPERNPPNTAPREITEYIYIYRNVHTSIYFREYSLLGGFRGRDLGCGAYYSGSVDFNISSTSLYACLQHSQYA